jgi:hypothetical protein
MKKRCFKGTALAVAAIFLIPSIAFAWYSVITVTESGTAGYNMLACNRTANILYLVNNDFIGSTGLDTRVTQGAVERPHMLAEDRIMFTTPVAANSSNTLQFTTGSANLTAFYNIFGHDSSVTVADNETLELGDSFTIMHEDSWVDTEAGLDKDLVYKPGAFRSYVSATENITSALLNAYAGGFPAVETVNGGNNAVDNTTHTVNLPAGITLGDMVVVLFAADSIPSITFPSDWTQLFDVVSTTASRTACYYRIADGTEGSTIIVTTNTTEMTAHTSYRISGAFGEIEAATIAYTSSNKPNPPNLAPSWGNHNTLWIAATGAAPGNRNVNVYPAGYANGRQDKAHDADGAFVASAEDDIAAASEDPASFRLNNSASGLAITIGIAPADTEIVSVTATGIAEGEHTTNTTANVTHLIIEVDGTVEDTTALTANVTNNAESLLFLRGNVMPYCEALSISINGTTELSFQPNAIILGTTLPDRATGANDGTISWGSNPASVNVTLGALLADYTPLPTGSTPTTPNVVPVITPPVVTADAAKLAALAGHPLTPVIHIFAVQTGIYELVFWWFGVILAALVAFGLVFKYGGKNLVMGTIAFSIVFGYGVTLGIYDFWFIAVIVVVATAAVTMERKYL